MNETTSNAPFVQRNSNYGMIKTILLGLITLGIYNFIFLSKSSSDINTIASQSDGEKTMDGALMLIISIVLAILPFIQFLSWILPLVWFHTICTRIGAQLKARGIEYQFGAGTYWGWSVFGALIIVGPFIWLYKFCRAMNLLCDDYNARRA